MDVQSQQSDIRQVDLGGHGKHGIGQPAFHSALVMNSVWQHDTSMC